MGRKATDPAGTESGAAGLPGENSIPLIGCISHGFNHATNGGAVLLLYLHSQKKIRILYFLPLLVIFALCSLPLPAASAAMVTLSWDANSEPDLVGYILHYGTSSRDYLDGVDVGNTTGCTISGLDPGQVYYFAVTAYNTVGESGFSEEVAYTIPDTPPPPSELQYELSVATVGNGSVVLDPPGGTYNKGTVVQLTAVADSGSSFDKWSRDITGTVNPINITMNDDKAVTANFEAVVVPLYTLTADIVGNGSVDLDPPGPTYNEGTVVQLTAVADPGSAFDNWSGDVTGSANPVTITMDADINVTATFTESAYHLFGDI